MERRSFIKKASMATLATGGIIAAQSCTCDSGLKKGEIIHSVIFDLKHPVGSAEAKDFLETGKSVLTKIPGVQDFQAYRQCSPKNDYQYGFVMRFHDQKTFDAYTANPDHCKFVKERWDTEVTRFMESDFEQL